MIHIRMMNRDDLPQLLAIEEASFPAPWNEKDFRATLQPKNAWGKVAIVDDKVVGFIIYLTAKKTYNVISLAVHPDYRRKGIGRELVNDMLEKVHPLRRNEARLTVSDQNLDAQLFFRSLGFRATEILKDFFGPGHDGYEFVYKANQPYKHDKKLDEICQGK